MSIRAHKSKSEKGLLSEAFVPFPFADILLTRIFGGPQLSQQQQITHSNNKLIATITKTSHQNQIAHSTNKMLTAQMKTLTAQTKTLTAQTKTLTAQTKTHSTGQNSHAQTKTLRAPPNRGGLSCLFPD